MVFFVVLLFVVSHGLWSVETTQEKYDRYTRELTEISKELNELSVNSEITLADLMERLPQLMNRVSVLQNEVEQLLKESTILTENSQVLLTQWVILKDGIDKVSNDIETLQKSHTIFEDSLKRSTRRSNTGLIIASIALIITGYLLYEEHKDKLPDIKLPNIKSGSRNSKEAIGFIQGG